MKSFIAKIERVGDRQKKERSLSGSRVRAPKKTCELLVGGCLVPLGNSEILVIPNKSK